MAITLISSPSAWRLSNQPTFYQVETNQGSKADIRIDLFVRVHNADGTHQIIGRESLNPDANGVCTFEISEYFKPYIKPVFNYSPPKDTFNYLTDLRTNKTTSSATFSCIIQEYYDGEYQNYIQPGQLTITAGAIPHWAQPKFYKLYADYMQRLLTGDRILSLSHLYSKAAGIPHRIRTAKTDPQRIPIILLQPPDETIFGCWYTISIIFTDLTTDFYIQHTANEYQLQNLTHGVVLEFATGYNELHMDTWVSNNASGKTVKEYTLCPFLSITGQQIPLCEPITYELDHNYYPQRRNFAFLNSLGDYDTIAFSGQSETEVEYNHEIVDQPFWPGSASALKKSILANTTETIKCNTGFISRTQLAYLPEFLKSIEIFEIVEDQLVPVIIANQTVLRHKDQPELWQVNIEYEHAPRILGENFIIPDPPPPPPPPPSALITHHAVDPDTHEILIYGSTNMENVKLQVQLDNGAWADHGSSDTGANLNAGTPLPYSFNNSAYNVGDLIPGGIISGKPSSETHYLHVLALDYPQNAAVWLSSKIACQGHNAAGFTNWRMPNRGELQTIRNNIFLSHNETAQLSDGPHWSSTEGEDSYTINDYIEKTDIVFDIEITPPDPWPFSQGQIVTIKDATGDWEPFNGQWTILKSYPPTGKLTLTGSVPEFQENPTGDKGIVAVNNDAAYQRIMSSGAESLVPKSSINFARPIRNHYGASSFRIKAWNDNPANYILSPVHFKSN
jgi:hypothetical protein